MRIVIALGGNALLRRGQRPDPDVERRNARTAARSVAEIARRHSVVITHGNGPQIGVMALATDELAEAVLEGEGPSGSGPAATSAPGARPRSGAYTLDLLGAATEGMIGYMLEQELRNALPGWSVATLLTQTLVDPDDPAFDDPTKFIGPVYTEEEARRLAGERGWSVARDGEGWRRVVASPTPQEILELPEIEALVHRGTLVVCSGGGGIPVLRTPEGFEGVEAVIDKDRSAALLARRLGAGALLMLTDVSEVRAGWGTPEERPIRRATPDEMRRHDFAAGSMGPKVEAACTFVEETGGWAAIGALEDAEAILEGEAGTRIHSPDEDVADRSPA